MRLDHWRCLRGSQGSFNTGMGEALAQLSQGIFNAHHTPSEAKGADWISSPLSPWETQGGGCWARRRGLGI
jgi:hypothetical protein